MNFEKNMIVMKTEIYNMKIVKQTGRNTEQRRATPSQNWIQGKCPWTQHNRKLETENGDLKKKITGVTNHSMKYNLIFGGVEHVDHNENT